MRELLASMLVLSGACLGCTGRVGLPAGVPSDTTGTDPSKPDPGNPASEGPFVPSPDTGLWRLTRTEYSNTMRDLLGDTTRPGNQLDPDGTHNGFDNNAEILRLSVVAFDRYDTVAADIIERALRAGSASRKKLLGTCDPVTATCARTVVAAFARRAWRRPVASAELDDLVASVGEAAAQGDPVEEGVKLALRIVLVSPNFLYRVEADPPASMRVHPVTPHELATRLSYFVWSSTPDDRLLDLADDGSLARPDVFAAELGRMLGDARADALVTNFGAQWLNLGKLDASQPDPKVFKNYFDEDLRRAMSAEPQSFFRAFLNGDRSILDMLDADFTFVNERLAKHYRLTGVTGTSMRQVPVSGAASHRFGLLSQAGMLTLTSNPNRTSPVNRGKWVLSRLLCAPPPPPQKVPTLEESAKSAGLPANATVRQMMDAHRKKPECAACHAGMDAIGFGLEHYDGIGMWRDSYATNAIDATGELPGGIKFDGAYDLSQKLKADPRFTACFARTLFGYAFGREPTARGDLDAVDKLAAGFTQAGARIKDLITFTASSKAFQLRGGPQ